MGQKQIEQMLADFQSTFEEFYDPDNHDTPEEVMNYGFYYLLYGMHYLGYRPNCVSGGGAVGGAVVFGWGVEFVPVDAGAVSHRDSGRLPCPQRAVFPGFSAERLDLSVRDGVGREPRVGFRMHGVLVAPPAHRLDPPAPGTGPGAGAASRGCVACGYEGPCVQKDDAEMIRQKLLASDTVVFATPLYYHGMSAQRNWL